jgi:RHH-type proline utilization regulon transcriptional repressor/proline dehydrogenase/delta 1-pyrroline-5-carboxylate dehydrogenase
MSVALAAHPAFDRDSPLRAAITAAYRRPEADCIAALLADATLSPDHAAAARADALDLVTRLRATPKRGLVENLLQEYALSSQEGIALMCLAEALLRIPDAATRDALIRDKIGGGDWRAHLGASPSLFVNAATWGLLLTGTLTATSSETGLGQSLTRLLGRGGEPVIRAGVHMAMRLMGEQFVAGQTIEAALAHARKWEVRGFRYSYDMLGEAALTAADAARYFADYEAAIHAIGRAANGRGLHDGPGISIKLSALHPRYSRAQRPRVLAQLLPRLASLAALARRYDIGLNIDAEEADRLDLSLDLLEALCLDPALRDWNGVGFVVQAYQKRAPFVLDFIIDLARRTNRRIMLRLVKGAYWDSEIKRAQVDGMADFPVFTRKRHTDISYLACARKMLSAPDALFAQFATHNAQTAASIRAMAGPDFSVGQYEFQCLHGMGEPLYEEIVGADKWQRPARIYAPVGTHETLLAYLVRRLLENGANTSFVNQIADPRIDVVRLVADPAAPDAARGEPHEKIARPPALFAPARRNSAGYDLSNEDELAALGRALTRHAGTLWEAAPTIAAAGPAVAIRNPANTADLVGHVIEASPEMVAAAVAHASQAAASWAGTPPAERAACLDRAAAALEANRMALLSLLVREAGKTLPAAIGEIREAVDFLRYYGAQVRAFDNATHRPLGVIAAISPWNFPLAIFLGQIAAALAAGNAVVAKPAEETPLVAAFAVRLLHEAGIPPGALHVLPGDGAIGAALIARPAVRGVLFTGSTEVARAIQAQLAARVDSAIPIPLIAETGGQNAMVVDSSALAEQAVNDIIASAFDSAGQRCSALRILLVQEELAPRLLEMLRGAMAELRIGDPAQLETDIGPLISAAARETVETHIGAMRARGFAVSAAAAAPDASGFFVAPTVIEIPTIACLGREVFGPVLHVLRYRRAALDEALDAVNALGYGLTFGIHSRIDETIAQATQRIHAGNIYVNRNIIGAVVGVQPFGGHGLSGTGPKAGGPLYLRRLLGQRPAEHGLPAGAPPAAFHEFLDHLAAQGIETRHLATYGTHTPLGATLTLPGPVGEQNDFSLEPRGRILCRADTRDQALHQIAAALATDNTAYVLAPELPPLPDAYIKIVDHVVPADAALFEGDAAALRAVAQVIMSVHTGCPLEFLTVERTVSVNTAAAGGNASLMTIG